MQQQRRHHQHPNNAYNDDDDDDDDEVSKKKLEPSDVNNILFNVMLAFYAKQLGGFFFWFARELT